MVLSYSLIFLLFHALFSRLVGKFNHSIAIFLLLPPEMGLLSGAYLKHYTVYAVPSHE